MRSAASLSATSLRAAAMSAVTAPPSTTMPSGAPRDASQAGKRCSSEKIRMLPSGDRPAIASSTTLVIMSRLPAPAKRVHSSNAPPIATRMMKLDGTTKKPAIFDSTYMKWEPGEALGRHETQPLVAAAQPRHERDRGQHHPGLADDLAQQEVERAERQIEEHDRVHDQPDHAGGDHGRHQAAASERRI